MSDLSQRLTVAELRRQQMEQFREANPGFAAQVDAVLEPITQLLAAMRAELDEITGRDRGSSSVGSSRPTFAGSPTSAVGATPLAPATFTPAPSAVTGSDGGAGGDAGFPVPNPDEEPDDGHDMFLLRIGVCPETGGEHQMVRDGDERGTYWCCENCGVQES